MKFLCDVHIPYKLVKYLQRNNCSCFHVNQLFQDPKTKDKTISDYADANDFIIITKDSDFKESHFLKKTPRKLIKLNTGNSSTKQIINLFEKNWNLLQKVSEQNIFLIETDLINFLLLTEELDNS